jgi:predicted ABC-type exoprotein transport system permease subunit
MRELGFRREVVAGALVMLFIVWMYRATVGHEIFNYKVGLKMSSIVGRRKDVCVC